MEKTSKKNNKTKISIAIEDENFIKMNELNLNKSKFVNWLLLNYFNKKGDFK